MRYRSAAGGVLPLAVAVAVVAVNAALGVGAWLADMAVPGTTTSRAVVDVGVGVLLTCAALLVLPARPRSALLVGAAGATWLLGSIYALGTLHQGFLLLALGTAALSGARPSVRALGVLTAAAVCASGVGDQLISGVLCVGVAALAAAPPGQLRERAFAAAGATVLAVVLLASWVLQRVAWTRVDPHVLLVAYELAVVAAAGCLVLAVSGSAGTARRVRRALAGATAPGPERRRALVEHLLRGALRDPSLTLVLDRSEVSGAGSGQAHMVVTESGAVVALVMSTSALLDDPGVATAVAEVVRPVAASVRLQHEQEQQLAELGRSRTRVIAAVDEERAAMAAVLRSGPLRRLDEVIDALSPLTDPRLDSSDVRTALEQLEGARQEVLAIVRGAPPVELGDGAIVSAVHALAQVSPLDVRVTVTDGVAAPRPLEEAAFYVCSEALTNAARHSGARLVRVALSQPGGALVLEVRDDGRGGADPSGSGLRGLADRVESAGGSLTISSADGGGTVVLARLGDLSRRSAATA